MKRTAILLDENGKEIYRGNPADLPVRFLSEGGDLIEHSMSAAVDVGTPIDPESGDDLTLYDEGGSSPLRPQTGTISIIWYTTDGQDSSLGAYSTLPNGSMALMSTACGSNGGTQGYDLTRLEIEKFVSHYEQLAKDRGFTFLAPTDLYDDFEDTDESTLIV